jgi:hypothetical protein
MFARGVDISSKVSTALTGIVDHARQVDELATEVAHSSSEQTQGITQINSAVGQMDRVTQGNAASAEESAAAAQELEHQARAMKDAVESLLSLVGRSSHTPADHHESVHAYKPAKNGGSGNGHTNGSHPVTNTASKQNGHSNGKAHASTGNGNGKANGNGRLDEIPLESGFRDF